MDDQGKIISLKDYTKICTSDYKKPSNSEMNLPEDITKDLVDILRDKSKQGTIHVISGDNKTDTDSNKKVSLVSELSDGWWTQKYVGILQYEDMTIYIGSRFDDDKHFFTSYVLSKALGMNALLFKDMHPSLGQERVLQMLLAIVFVDQIKTAQKHGLFRMYQSYERNDAKVRGKIDVTRHINLNPLFNGKIAYSYREYTADNDINRIIYTAFTMLEKEYKPLMKGLLNRNRSVKDCMSQMGNIVTVASRQEVPTLLKQKKMKIHHSIYKDWEAVRKTAVMILRHMGVNISKEEKHEINGVLIDMTKIWETYLKSIFQKMNVGDLKLVMEPDTRTMTLFSSTDKEKGRRQFEPDYYWMKKQDTDPPKTVAFIADAKYKSSWSEMVKQEIEKKGEDEWDNRVREDVFQVLAYMYALNCSRGAIICPVPADNTNSSDKKKEDYQYSISKVRKEDFFYLFPLFIPQSKDMDYATFQKDMKNEEENLRTVLEQAITKKD